MTKPLATAPPSALLDEVVAAYDAAYADLLAAGSIPDENYPALSRHIGDPQLEKWREVIRGLRTDGKTVRDVPGAADWRRVEYLDVVSASVVRLNVCRMQRQETVFGGVGTGADHRPYRYLETLELRAGSWKWIAREWVDSAAESSDCALP